MNLPRKIKKRVVPAKLSPASLLSPRMKILVYLSLVLLVLLGWWKINRQKNTWTAFGESPNDHFGDKVAPAGDVNGDGFADVAVWASGHADSAGKVYVYLGSPRGLSASPSWAVQGESRIDQYGHSFGTAGDVNGDGFGDFIVGAQGYNGPAGTDVGKAYLYLGSPQGLSLTPVWTKTGGEPFELLGDCSGRAGDVNHDGLDDVIVGAYGYRHFKGKTYLFLGSKNGGLSPVPVWTTQGENPEDWYGYSVASAGDVNGDGYPDLIIGAKYARLGKQAHVGKVYAYYGSKNGYSKIPSWMAVGEHPEGLFGWRAISAGDVNGDGYADVIVSSYRFNTPTMPDAGKVYVYYGSPHGLSSRPDWTQAGEMTNAFFGMTIASGDFNHDGYSDIVVGSPDYQQGRGKIYLFLGGPHGLSPTPSFTMVGEKEGDHFGSYVAGVGDVNGDGFNDILIGAPNNSEKGENNGKVYLLYGNSSGRPSLLPPLFSKFHKKP